MAPLLDFISDQGVKKAKGKQKAGKSKKTRQDMGPQTGLKGQEKDPLESTNSIGFQPVLVEPIKGKSLSCDPDKIASKIKEAREDPDSNVWNLPMFDFSRDQIMQYIDGYFGAERSKILSSIQNRDSTFPRMVCTAVKYWNDKQLIVPLLQMVKEVFDSSSDSKETYHLLMTGKVELSIVLLACFLNEEDIFQLVLGILSVSNLPPFTLNYDKSEELLLIVSSVLTYVKRIETHAIFLSDILNLILCMQKSMEMFHMDESDIQKTKRFLVKEGIVDIITQTEALSTKTWVFQKLQDVCITTINWIREEVKPVDMIRFYPSALQLLNRITSQNQLSFIDDHVMSNCISFLQFFIVHIPYRIMMKILNKDSIGLIIRTARLYPKGQDQILNILGHAVAKDGNDESGLFEDMVNRLKHHPLTLNSAEACLNQLNIIMHVFLLKGKEGVDRMIDNGILAMMIETLLKAEELRNMNKEKSDITWDPIIYVLKVVQLVIQVGSRETVLKIVKTWRKFRPKILSKLSKYTDQSLSLMLLMQLYAQIGNV